MVTCHVDLPLPGIRDGGKLADWTSLTLARLPAGSCPIKMNGAWNDDVGPPVTSLHRRSRREHLIARDRHCIRAPQIILNFSPNTC
jgi:hypothetical protein